MANEFQEVIAAIREDRAELAKIRSYKDPRAVLIHQLIDYQTLMGLAPLLTCWPAELED